jgi:hypothetical protein
MQSNEATPQVNEISPNESEDDNLRGTAKAEKPFCWQSKKALRAIRQVHGNDRSLPYLMSTYLALSEIASDEGRPKFTKSVADILAYAGGSYRKLTQSLAALHRLGVVRIKHNFFYQDDGKGKSPSTYSLLTTTAWRAEPLRTVGIASVPISEKNANAIKERTSLSKQSDWRLFYSASELTVIDQYNSICVPRGWLSVNANSEQLRSALDIFQDHNAEWFKRIFTTAVADRDAGKDYTAPMDNKLLRILWANY